MKTVLLFGGTAARICSVEKNDFVVNTAGQIVESNAEDGKNGYIKFHAHDHTYDKSATSEDITNNLVKLLEYVKNVPLCCKCLVMNYGKPNATNSMYKKMFHKIFKGHTDIRIVIVHTRGPVPPSAMLDGIKVIHIVYTSSNTVDKSLIEEVRGLDNYIHDQQGCGRSLAERIYNDTSNDSSAVQSEHNSTKLQSAIITLDKKLKAIANFIEECLTSRSGTPQA